MDALRDFIEDYKRCLELDPFQHCVTYLIGFFVAAVPLGIALLVLA